MPRASKRASAVAADDENGVEPPQPKKRRGKAKPPEVPPPSAELPVNEVEPPKEKKRGKPKAPKTSPPPDDEAGAPPPENGVEPPKEKKKRGKPKASKASPPPDNEAGAPPPENGVEPPKEKKKRGKPKAPKASPPPDNEAGAPPPENSVEPPREKKKLGKPKASPPPDDETGAPPPENGVDAPQEQGHPRPSIVVLIAYRLNGRACGLAAKCSQKCPTNPRCLKDLGQDAVLNEESTPEERIEKALFYAGYGLRGENRFVGIRNLGSTCFVCGPLHLLNIITPFKIGLFKWNPFLDPVEREGFGHNVDPTVMPISPVGSTIGIIVDLMTSRRAFVDPEPLLKNFDIKVNDEQDSGEFFTLNIQSLEATLSHQVDPDVKNLCQKLFRGSTQSTITCQKCGTVSGGSPVHFYLFLLGLGVTSKKRDLMELLKRHTAVEKLTGANKYACKVCNAKQEAIKQERFVELPPYLVLQLQRTVSPGAEKNMSPVAFSDTLDLSSLLNEEDGSRVYSLVAVLSHTGKESNTGHYETHIFDQTDRRWYKFNDEVVEPRDVPDFDDDNKRRSGNHLSSETYLLVYGKKDFVEGTDPMDVPYPDWVEKYVRADADKFAIERANALKREIENEEERAKRAAILRKHLSTDGKSPMELVPRDILAHYVSNAGGDAPAVDYGSYLCQHGRLLAEKAASMKCVSVELANHVYEGVNDVVRFGYDMFCEECVELSQIRAERKKMAEDDLHVVQQLLQISPSEPASGFWVGKESLKNWKKMASEDFGRAGEKFNSDATCVHGGLIVDAKKRKLICLSLWEVFLKYFPESAVFEGNAEACAECVEEVKKQESIVKDNIRRAGELKNSIGPILNRQKVDVLAGPILLLPDWFVKAVRSFLKTPGKSSLPTSVDYGSVLCEHGKIGVDVHDETQLVDKFFVAKLSELEALKEVFQFPIVMSGKAPADWDDEVGTIADWTFEPEICVDCATARRLADDAALYQYQGKGMYLVEMPVTDGIYTALNEDKFNANGDLITKKGSAPLPQAMIDAEDPNHNPGKKGKRVNVSSSDTLWEVKQKIMERTNIPVEEQLIFLGKGKLLPDDYTLEDLKVLPGAHLIIGFRKNRLPGAAGFGGKFVDY